MSEIMKIIEDFKTECACGREHKTEIKDIRIASGLVHEVGSILRENGFSENILLVADKNTLKAADGILDSLTGFNVEMKLYDDLRVATIDHVNELRELIAGRDISVLSVGTGSINDPCRMACARENKLLCIFATAPSMDGFASYNAPIVNNGFKISYDAKSPEVIIGDTKILANAPSELKSAGFGDMVAKYVGLVDWKISALLTGEYYCERIAALTRSATDELMQMADKVTVNDERTAGMIFESLLKTGIAMSFTKNSRPASGCEHVIAHVIECIELQDGIIPNLHGDDVGVCSLEMLKYYNSLAENAQIETQNESVDWDSVYEFYGDMADDIHKMNDTDNIIDTVDKDLLKAKWSEIVKIIHSVPNYDECKAAMEKAGCKITSEDIGKEREFFENCIKYSPYMRRRLTLLRMKDMIKTI